MGDKTGTGGRREEVVKLREEAGKTIGTVRRPGDVEQHGYVPTAAPPTAPEKPSRPDTAGYVPTSPPEKPPTPTRPQPARPSKK